MLPQYPDVSLNILKIRLNILKIRLKRPGHIKIEIAQDLK